MDANTTPPTDAAKTPETNPPRIRLPHRMRNESPPPRQGSNRETIESVVIAFVLAFLFRTFEAEAFVIPTGSMAPTLMGRHKEVMCQECSLVFTVGETEGQDALTDCVCPNCRFVNDVRDHPPFKGDRILVLKALYDLPGWIPDSLRNPRRWDVVVFKFPEEPQVNYIKRLVGLPGEELRLRHGNIYTRGDGEEKFQIARKSAEKQKVLRMIVYDNNHQSPAWRDKGWPDRWQAGEGEEAWTRSNDGHTLQSPAGLGESSEWATLSYRHYARMWERDDLDGSPPPEQLITDFYAYNAGIASGYQRDDEKRPRWVGDLSISLRAEITAPRGKMRIELVEGGDRFTCEFDLSAGTCRLLKGPHGQDQEEVLATAPQGIMRPGRYSIGFGNTDDRLTVWLDDKLLFGDGFDYDGPALEDRVRPMREDLRPATIAVQGTHVRVSDLVLYRDIYYTFGENGGSLATEYDFLPPGSWDEMLSDPNQWHGFAEARISSFGKLGPDDFMMMGDNSPRSKDGRLWAKGARMWLEQIANDRNDYHSHVLAEIAEKPGGQVVLAQDHVVNRHLLIGRAFFVYWPHGVPFGPDWLQFDTPRLGPIGSFRLPFYPNVARMKMIE